SGLEKINFNKQGKIMEYSNDYEVNYGKDNVKKIHVVVFENYKIVNVFEKVEDGYRSNFCSPVEFKAKYGFDAPHAEILSDFVTRTDGTVTSVVDRYSRNWKVGAEPEGTIVVGIENNQTVSQEIVDGKTGDKFNVTMRKVDGKFYVESIVDVL
ncbi:hypothetical protein IKQ21_09245, partial [bacterium]|nr:hypothetical protein [bacterium]